MRKKPIGAATEIAVTKVERRGEVQIRGGVSEDDLVHDNATRSAAERGAYRPSQGWRVEALVHCVSVVVVQ